MYKMMICVGEASGDLHGARVAAELKIASPDIEMFGMGGSQMLEAGVDIVYDIAEIGVMGFFEVLKNLPKFFWLRSYLARVMDERRPDVLLLIDFGGFNMKLAAVAKEKGIPVIYYICPKAWVWGKGRAKTIASTVDGIAAIFPFEADLYRKAGGQVTFVGHPLVDIVKPGMTREQAYSHFGADSRRPILLLLPGSRKQEVEGLLPTMLASARLIQEKVPGCQFYLPVAHTIPRARIEAIVEASGVSVHYTQNGIYDLMQIADCAIAASGTVTLEAALLGLPSVIVYKVAWATYWLCKIVLTITDVGLPNIVAGRRILPELIQGAATPDNISAEVVRLVLDPSVRQKVHEDLLEVRAKLGEPGAVQRVAEIVVEMASRGLGGSK